jgi:hypothetical protein
VRNKEENVLPLNDGINRTLPRAALHRSLAAIGRSGSITSFRARVLSRTDEVIE